MACFYRTYKPQNAADRIKNEASFVKTDYLIVRCANDLLFLMLLNSSNMLMLLFIILIEIG